MKDGYSTYKTVNVDTADQGKLILICYDVAIKSCKLALEKFNERDQIEARTKHLFKAQDAVNELLCSLKLDVGEIASRLYQLYEYMIHRLVQANVKNEPQHVTEILGYLESLRDAWSQAVVKVKKESIQIATESLSDSVEMKSFAAMV